MGLCLFYRKCCRSVFRISQWIHDHQEDCCASPEEGVLEGQLVEAAGVSISFNSTLSTAPHTPLNPEEPLFTLSKHWVFDKKQKRPGVQPAPQSLMQRHLTSTGPSLPILDPKGSKKVLYAPWHTLSAGLASPCFGSEKSVTLCLCVPASE